MVQVIYENKYSGLTQALQGLIAGMDKQYRRKQALESIVQQFQPDQQETIRKQLAGMPLEAIEQFTTVNMLNNMRNRQNQQDFISAANAIGVNLPENTNISDPVTQRLVLDAINRKQTPEPQKFNQYFGLTPEEVAAANRAENQRKIKGSSGSRRVIDFWDKDGNKRKKLVNDDNFNEVIQSIVESGGRLEEDSLTKELSYWQTSLQKTLDPLGDVLPGQEETAALANERIGILRDLIRGKSLPAEQPQLQGNMTEQQADTQQQAIEPETIDEFWKKGLDRLEDEHAGLASSDAMENFKKEFVDYATKKLGMTKEQAEGEFIIRWVEGRNKRSFWRDDVLPNLPGEISKDKIMVYSPTGEMGVIPRKQLKEAIKQGYRLVR